MEPLFTLAATELRRLLEQLLPTEADLDAFVLDYFPVVKRRFGAGMDRVSKTNLLFEMVERGVLSGQLRTVYPDAFAFILMIEKGNDVGRQYPLPCPGYVSIGRALDADIRLPEQETQVSRRHAMLEINETGVMLARQGRLPVYVNGEEVTTSLRVRPGSVIEIHRTIMRLHAGSSRAAEPTDSAVVTAERESMPAARSSAYKLFWNLSDRMLEMNRVQECERMVGRRLEEMRNKALGGARFDHEMVAYVMPRILRLAVATRKADWYGWIFELARLAKYRLELPLVDELCDEISAQRPPIAAKLSAYIAAFPDADSQVRGRLEALCQTLQKL